MQRLRLCRNATHVFTFFYFGCPQVKSRTTVRGKVAGGSSPVRMSWRDTSENTRDRSHMSACSATEPSAVLTTWHYTWRDMCEAKHKQNTTTKCIHTLRLVREGISVVLRGPVFSRWDAWLCLYINHYYIKIQLTCTYCTLYDKGEELVVFFFLWNHKYVGITLKSRAPNF